MDAKAVNPKPLDPRAVKRGAAIKAARDASHMSQESVAANLGLTRARLSQIEKGQAGELESSVRRSLCKMLGFEERDLLLDQDGTTTEFDVPLSREAKSIAYRWDDLPEALRAHLKAQMAEAERLKRESPNYAKTIFPELDESPKNRK